MTRESLIEAAEAAMVNILDMDTGVADFAAAAVDALGWQLFDDGDLPEPGDLVALTDGEARWIGKFYPGSSMHWRQWADTREHVATHWHPIHDLPARGVVKSKGTP